MEHRRGSRQRTFTLIQIKYKNIRIRSGLLYNVSRDGAFIISSIYPEPSSIINIYMPNYSKNTDVFPASGIVIHSKESGFGILFCRNNNSTQQLIDKLVNKTTVATQTKALYHTSV